MGEAIALRRRISLVWSCHAVSESSAPPGARVMAHPEEHLI
jgi:hypothetical protein